MPKEEDRLKHFDGIAKASIRTYMLTVSEAEEVGKNQKLARSHPLTKKLKALPTLPVDMLLVNRQKCDEIDGFSLVWSRAMLGWGVECTETMMATGVDGSVIRLDTRRR